MAPWSLRSALLTLGLQACFRPTCAEIAFVEKLQEYLHMGKPSHEQIHEELGAKLSENAILITEGSEGFREATIRWQEFRPPTFRASVQVANEEDIQETIRYANAHDIPFLATTGKHGEFSTLQGLQNGIQIDMRTMDKVEVSPDGKYATVGGGIKQLELIQALKAAEKRTVTGLCECVGTGVVLGGGHGFLQGQYGLIGDQVVEWRLVLANSTIITVSAESHPDLFWAMNGAGHNFGIVTEYKTKVYELGSHDTWSMELFFFAGDQVEDVYATANELMKTQPAEAVHMSMWLINPEIDAEHLSIMYTVLYDGPAEDLKEQLAPLHALNPLFTMAQPIVYTDMPATFLSSNKDPACQRNVATLMRFPVDFQTFNTTAMRQAYDLVAATIQEEPAFKPLMIAVEQYSIQGVQAIDATSTAFPWRDDSLLVSLFLAFGIDPALNDKAAAFGQHFRRIVQAGTGRDKADLHAYINYADGSEGMGAWYGYDEWRLEKLRHVKREFDPKGRFSWYAPITEADGAKAAGEEDASAGTGKSEL